MEIREALDELFGPTRARNFTHTGYQRALAQVRARDPKLARRIQRALKPVLPRFFPRESRPFGATSRGAKARAEFLPQNPHLFRDVQEIRRALHLPELRDNSDLDDRGGRLRLVDRAGVFRSRQVGSPEASFPRERSVPSSTASRRKEEAERRRWIPASALASLWLHAHRAAASGQRSSEIDLPEELRASAEAAARIDLTSESLPEWVRREQGAEEGMVQAVAPIDWVAHRLTLRYRIRAVARTKLVFFILTQDTHVLAGIPFLDVRAGFNREGDIEIRVSGIDEFVTADEWAEIFKQATEPCQEILQQERATMPSGQSSVNLDRLTTFLPLYRAQIKNNWSFTQLLESDVVSTFDEEASTIRRALARLRVILDPDVAFGAESDEAAT